MNKWELASIWKQGTITQDRRRANNMALNSEEKENI